MKYQRLEKKNVREKKNQSSNMVNLK